MSYENDIANAPNPQAALLVIGRALDRIEHALRTQERALPAADPWGTWSSTSSTGTIEVDEPSHVPEQTRAMDAMQRARDEQAIAAVKLQLSTETDPKEIQALSAKLRLLEDKGQTLDSPVQEGRRAAIASDGTNGTVELPPIDPTRRRDRERWAEVYKLWDYIPLDEKTATSAFGSGGPMWLYLANRDAVMQLPFAARQWLVRDLAEDSQAQAQEVGRDILKSEDSVDKDITLAAVDAISASRG